MKILIIALVAVLISNLSVAATSGYVLQWGVSPDWPSEEVIDTSVGCGMLFSLTLVGHSGDQNHSSLPFSVGPVFGATCTVYRAGQAIANVTTTGARTYFTDYDVIPGVEYDYEIKWKEPYNLIEYTTGSTNVTCACIYSTELATNEVVFAEDEDESKVYVSIYKQTVASSRLLGRYEAYFGTTASDDWIYSYRSDDCKYCHICVDENNSDEPREGFVTINFEGFEWKIKVRQAGKQSNVTVETGNCEVTIPTTWYSENCAALLAEHDGDYVATALADAANGMKVWECYVAGTNPTNAYSRFTASITFDVETNKPIIGWSPELPTEESAKRTYRKFGKNKLNDANWTEIAVGEEANYNFFKVTVEMK